MTLREVELWMQGREDLWTRVMEVLAWMQVNLINIHVAKGTRLTIEDVLPRGARKRKQEKDAPAFDDPKAMKAWMRQVNEDREDKIFWGSPEGAQLRDRLGLEEYEEDEPRES